MPKLEFVKIDVGQTKILGIYGKMKVNIGTITHDTNRVLLCGSYGIGSLEKILNKMKELENERN